MSFFPLDRRVLDSSIYRNGTAVEWKVWTHLLLKANVRTGTYDAQTWVIAKDTNLTEEEVEAALQAFEGPDPYSRTKTDDGRRIRRDGTTIILLNYAAHRDADYSAPRVKAWRKRQKDQGPKENRYLKRSVTPVTEVTVGNDRHGHRHNGRNTDGDGSTVPSSCDTPVEERVSGAAAPATPPSWSQEACDDWIAAYEGTAPGGPIGRHLKPLVAKHGWANVRLAWQAYLQDTEPQFANPARFAATYGSWKVNAAPPKPAPPEPLPKADRTAYDFFEAMKVRLSGVLSRDSVATWFRPTLGRAWEGEEKTLVLVVPTKQFAEQMRFYAPRMRAAAAELGKPELTFRVIVHAEDLDGTGAA